MKISNKTGFIAAAALLSISATASATDLLKGTYDSSTYVTAASGNLCSAAGLAKGAAQTSTLVYPGAGQVRMVLASPFTKSTGKAGSAATNVCVSTAKVPATGIDGATMVFACYDDTISGPAAKPQAQLRAKFNIGGSHSTSIYQATVTSQILVNGTPICTFTTDGTYALQ